VIDSTFKDETGLVKQVILRYRRTDSLSTWSISDVWTQYLTTTTAYRTENNISFHKLSFPINSFITWNGNDANTLDEEMYYYDYFHEPGTYNSCHFDSTISIIQIDENNYVQKKYGHEVYATNVGLILKEVDDLGKENGVVVNGMEYRMKVISYGNQ